MRAAQSSLQQRFTAMQEEFISSNNCTIRELEQLLNNHMEDMHASLKYFNEEHVVVDLRILNQLFKVYKGSLENINNLHNTMYKEAFCKELDRLKLSMCKFFKVKLEKGDNTRRKFSSDIKSSIDSMCDYNFLELIEKIKKTDYDFKVAFEREYIRDEYCKEDFNKIIKSFEHLYFEQLSGVLGKSVSDMMGIIERYENIGYEVINHYRKMQR